MKIVWNIDVCYSKYSTRLLPLRSLRPYPARRYQCPACQCRQVSSRIRTHITPKFMSQFPLNSFPEAEGLYIPWRVTGDLVASLRLILHSHGTSECTLPTCLSSSHSCGWFVPPFCVWQQALMLILLFSIFYLQRSCS